MFRIEWLTLVEVFRVGDCCCEGRDDDASGFTNTKIQRRVLG